MDRRIIYLPTFGSLFAGIGGFDLGLERAGWTCSWQVEIDEYCQRILAKHWPNARRHGDVRTFPPTAEADWKVDLICGGFPCQPVSLAGRRQGTSDPRWLWPEFARVIAVLRPCLVLVENVPGLYGNGMGDALVDLATCGYDAEWDCLSAAAVGAPHLRERVWLLAYPAGARQLRAEQPQDGCGGARRQSADDFDSVRETADSDSARLEGSRLDGFRASIERSDWWDIEPDVGRVAHGIPARVDRLRGLGNAVVPQVAEWIGKLLLAPRAGEEEQA